MSRRPRHTRAGLSRRGVAVAMAAVACALVAPSTALSAPLTLTVTGTADTNPVPACTGTTCPTLRGAVSLAMSNPGSTVMLDARTYTLGAGAGAQVGDGFLQIFNPVTIEGDGPGSTQIKQTDDEDDVITVLAATSGVVTLSGLTIEGGNAKGVALHPTLGGGIALQSGSTMELDDVAVSGNHAFGPAGSSGSTGDPGELGRGGGIYSEGTLTLRGSSVTGNTAVGGDGGMGTSAGGGAGGPGDGGGIYSSGSLELVNTTVSSNVSFGGGGDQGATTGGGGGPAFGGGITVGAGQLLMSATVVQGNEAQGGVGGEQGTSTAGTGGSANGGGMATNVGTQILSSSIDANEALGGSSFPTATGGDSGGGGVWADGGATALIDTTVSGNSVAAGSAGSAGHDSGGGLDAVGGGSFGLASSTITGNQADGAGTAGNVGDAGAVTFAGTIVAGGTAAGGGANCLVSGGAGATDNGHNLEDSGAGISQCGFSDGGADVLVAPGGAGLSASGPSLNGGSTPTVALTASSPAIAAGGLCTNPLNGMPLGLDQRGLPRPALCDIGAFQHQPPSASTGPSISGTPAVGQTLGCAEGAWSGDGGALAFAFQWLRDGAAIPGASDPTYTVQSVDAGHSLACLVAATGIGSTTATSAAVAIPAPPSPFAPPTPRSNTRGRAKVAAQTDTVTSTGHTHVKVSCSTAGPCNGTVEITVATRSGKAVAATATKRVVIARAQYSLKAGARKSVALVLTKRGRGFLSAHHGRLHVTLTVTGGSKAHGTLVAAKRRRPR